VQVTVHSHIRISHSVHCQKIQTMYTTVFAGLCLIAEMCAEDLQRKTQNQCHLGEWPDCKGDAGVSAIQMRLSKGKVLKSLKLAEAEEDSMDRKDSQPVPNMKELDKDKDGFVSLVELQKAAEAHGLKDKTLPEMMINTADADKDGKLSAAELPMAFEALRAIRELDKDGDGFVPLTDLQKVAEAHGLKDKKLPETIFNTADADKDGKLSSAELPVAFKAVKEALKGLKLAEAEEEAMDRKDSQLDETVSKKGDDRRRRSTPRRRDYRRRRLRPGQRLP